ncbi:T9SS type B sorting domain-containing protein [Aquirufa salirivi]|uniref:Gliding motility-associated C-terminal domain-containing protein n=1 Tax=Aquirufa salirivi TaxID=3104729 RepID=A0ABW8RUI9_9BACT
MIFLFHSEKVYSVGIYKNDKFPKQALSHTLPKSQAATQFRLTSINSTSVAGDFLNVNLEAIDSQGQVDLTYHGTKQVAFSVFENQLLDYPAIVNGSNFGELISVNFINGKAQVELVFFRAGLTTIQANDSGMVSNIFSIQVIHGVWYSFQIKLEPNFKNQSPVRGENQILAVDGFGNVVPDFDASENPVTIASAALDGVISGLGSKGNNVLDQSSDFVDGIADLTALGMIYSGQNINTDVLNVSTDNGVYVDSEPVEILPQDLENNYFVLEGSNSVHVGEVLPIKVVAKNILGFTESNYVGIKKLRFGGALTSGIYYPTANGVNFGEEIEVNFISGIAEVNLILRKAEQASIIVTDSTIASNSPLSVQVIPGPLTHFEIVGATKQQAGSVQTLSIRAIDIYGNVASFFSGTKSLIFSGASSTSNPIRNPSVSGVELGQAVQVAFTNGIAQVDLILYQVETAIIHVTDGIVSAKSALSIQVKFNQSNHFVISGNTTHQAGTSQKLSIALVDSEGNVNSLYTGTQTLTFSGASAANNPTSKPSVSGVDFGQAVQVVFANGVAQVDLILYKAESASISASDGTITTSSPLTILVNSGSVAHFLISGNTTLQAGSTQTLGIKAVDEYGNDAIEYTGTKTLTFTGASSTINPTRNPTASGIELGQPVQVVFTNGVAQVDLILYKAESASISVSDGTITTSSPLSIQVNSASASRFDISGNTTQQAGSVQTLSIKAVDDYGNVDTGFKGGFSDVNLTISGANASIDPVLNPLVKGRYVTGTFNQGLLVLFNQGLALVDLTLYKVESASISASDGTITTSSPLAIQVNSGLASGFKITGNSIQQVGSTQTLGIKAVDAYGNDAIEYTGTKTLTFTGASSTSNPTGNPTASGIEFGQPVQVAFTNGVAQVDLILYQVETANIHVSDSNISAKSALSIQVKSNQSSHFVISGNTTQQVGATQTLGIKAVDEYGNDAIEYTGTKTLTFSGASSTSNPTRKPTVSGIEFGQPVQVAFANGVAQVDLILYRVETANIHVSDGNISAKSALSIQVKFNQSNHFVISGNTTHQAGTSQKLSIALVDSEGNVNSLYTGTQTLTFSGASAANNPTSKPSVSGVDFGQAVQAVFTNGVAQVDLILYKAESASISVSDGTITTSSPLSIQVNPGLARRFDISGNTTQQAGSVQTLSIKAVDDYGNVDTGFKGGLADVNMVFSGANASMNPVLDPLVKGRYATGTMNQSLLIMFNSGVAQVDLTLYKVEQASIITSDGTISSNSLSIQVILSTSDRFEISGNTTQQAGTPQTLHIQVVDAYGNVDNRYSGTKTLTFSGASSASNPTGKPTVSGIELGQPVQVEFRNGIAQVDLIVYKVELAKIIASEGSMSTNSPLSIQVNSGTVTYFEINGSTTQLAGASQTLGIQGLDAYGNVDSQYSGKKTLTISGASSTSNPTRKPTVSGIELGQPVQVEFTNGVARVDLKVYQAEQAKIKAIDGNILTNSPLSIQVNPASASRFDVSGNTTQQAGSVQTLSIKAVDDYGNVDAGFRGGFSDVNLTFSGANASIDPILNPLVKGRYVTGTLNQGLIVLFNQGLALVDLTLYKVEQAAITVSNGILSSSPLGIQISAAPINKFNLAIQNQFQINQVVGENNQLIALDAYGNVATSFNPALDPIKVSTDLQGTVVGMGGNSSLVIDQSTQFAQGIADLKVLGFNYLGEAGEGTFTFSTASGIQVKSALVVVYPNKQSNYRFKISGESIQVAGRSQVLTIAIQDTLGNALSNFSGNLEVIFSGANASLTNSVKPIVYNQLNTPISFGYRTALYFEGGIAHAQLTLYRAELAAIGAKEMGTNVIPLDENKLSIQVKAADLYQLVPALESPQYTRQIFSGTNTLTAKDEYGNVCLEFNAANNPITLSLTSDGSVGFKSLSNTKILSRTTDFSQGIANLSQLGLYYSGLEGNKSFVFTSKTGITVTINPVQLVKSAQSVFLQISGNSTQIAGESSWFQIQALDANNELVTDYAGSKSLLFFGAGITIANQYVPTIQDSLSNIQVEFGKPVLVQFIGGKARVKMNLFLAETAFLTTRESINTGAIAGDSWAIQVRANKVAQLVSSISSPQTNGRPFVGVNTLTIKDAYGNICLDFDASKTPIMVTTSANASITGLGLEGGNVLNQSTDFENGVANLTALGLIYYSPSITSKIANKWVNSAKQVQESKNSQADPFAPSFIFSLTFESNLISTSASNVLISGQEERLVITGSSLHFSGKSQYINIQAKDAQGVLVRTYSGIKNLQFSESAATGNPGTIASTQGTPFGSISPIEFFEGTATVELIVYNLAIKDTIHVHDGYIGSDLPSDKLVTQVVLGNVSNPITGNQYEVTEDIYFSFDARQIPVWSIQGRNVVLRIDKSKITNEQLADSQTMAKLVERTDAIYEFYKNSLGYEPSGGNPNFGYKTSVFLGIPSCGSGCGLVGAKGIEVSGFDNMYFNLKNNTNVNRDVILAYEFGRNFFDFSSKVLFPFSPNTNEKNGGMAEAFASLFTAYAFDQIITDSDQRRYNESLINIHWFKENFIGYINDVQANPYNVLAKWDRVGYNDYNRGTGTNTDDEPAWKTVGLLQGIIDTFGKSTIFPKFFLELRKMSKVNTIEDALSNIAQATANCTQSNVVPFFKHVLKFNLNASTEAAINALPIHADRLIPYENVLWFLSPFHTVRINIRSINYLNNQNWYVIKKGNLLVSSSQHGNNEIPYSILGNQNEVNLTIEMQDANQQVLDSYTITVKKRHQINLFDYPEELHAFYLANRSSKIIQESGKVVIENLSPTLFDHGLLRRPFRIVKNRTMRFTSTMQRIGPNFQAGVVTNYTTLVTGGTFYGTGSLRLGYDIGQNITANDFTLNQYAYSQNMLKSGAELSVVNVGVESIGFSQKAYFSNLLYQDVTDTDGDGLVDFEDNCPSTYNPNQLDTDNDGLGNVCDDDLDNDGNPNSTDPNPLIALANDDVIQQDFNAGPISLNILSNDDFLPSSNLSITKISGTALGSVAFQASTGLMTYTPSVADADSVSLTYQVCFLPTGICATAKVVLLNTLQASKFILSGSASQVAGTSQTMTIHATTKNGTIVTDYTGTKTLLFSGTNSSSAPTYKSQVNGIDFGQNTALDFVNGIAQANLVIYKSGLDSISARDTYIQTNGSDRLGVLVSAKAFHNLAVQLQSPQVNQIPFYGVNTLIAQDEYDNTVSSFNASLNPITISSNQGGVISGLSGGNRLTSSSDFQLGRANLTQLGITYTGNIGSDTLIFQPVTGLGTKARMDILSELIKPSQLHLSGDSVQVAGSLQLVTIQVLNDLGELVDTYTGTKSLLFSGAQNSVNPVLFPQVLDNQSQIRNFGSVTNVDFVGGIAQISMKLFHASLAQIQVHILEDTLISSILPVLVKAGPLAKFDLQMTSPQTTETPFVGVNTLSALDAYGNLVTDFNAALQPIQVTSTLPGFIFGLSGGDQLTNSGDFVQGIANLSALGMLYLGAEGKGFFTFKSSSGIQITSNLIEILMADFDGDGIPNAMECYQTFTLQGNCQDFDGDGLVNSRDTDSDGDGIPDEREKNRDSDGDRHADYLDLDSDNDGILDSIEAEFDPDGDGIPNYLDLDSDNDGIMDVWEASNNSRGNLDDNYDGRVDKNGLLPDNNGNGLADFLETGFGGRPAPIPDTDKDAKPDYVDLDSDNDQILDASEGTKDIDGDSFPNYRDLDSDGDWLGDQDERNIDHDLDGIPNYLDLDSDGDGIPDAWEGKNKCATCQQMKDDLDDGWDDRGQYVKVIDTDSDGTSDFLDLDSDNDCIPDRIELGADGDGDEIPNFRDLDSDNDGMLDSQEAGDCQQPRDSDSDGLYDFEDADADNDTIPDSVEVGPNPTNPVDTDMDGKADYLDVDSDGDGIPDAVEAGSNPSKPVDSDGDGKANYQDLDSDNDTIPDSVEAGLNPIKPVDTDSDGMADYLDLDSDQDGMSDELEAGLDPKNPIDSDLDGQEDFRDLDSDNDGIPDAVEAGDFLQPIDSDADGKPDYRDVDSDNDGILDAIEVGPDSSKPLDTDGDGRVDYRDIDSDNDGMLDGLEAGKDLTKPVDSDGDGSSDYRDKDSDNDGIPDTVEAGSDPRNPLDTDKDGQEDFRDMDSDNDTIPDSIEAGLDPVIPVDTDQDGLANYRDLDSDGDSIPDQVEAGSNPLNPVDTDGDSYPDYWDLDSDNDTIPDMREVDPDVNHPWDTDLDGKEDFRDVDSDNDGIPDQVEVGLNVLIPIDSDQDMLPDYRDVDSDNNGLTDTVEAGPNPLQPLDTDVDGIADYRDTDDDNDEIIDTLENDINYGGLPDCDNDGIDNRVDSDICEIFAPQAISPNQDGLNDVLVIPGIFRMQPNRLVIYNRWGEVVFEMDNYQNNWGGLTDKTIGILTNDGRLPDGTYYYMVDFFGKYPNIRTFVYINRLAK